MVRSISIKPIHYHLPLILAVILGLLNTTGVKAGETVQPKSYHRTQLLTGFTEARQTIEVSSEVVGKCLAIHADIGDLVPDSGILAEIDDTFIRLDIDANRLEVESIKRQLQTEKKTLARYTTLIDKNSSTEAKLDEVQLSVDLHEMKLKTLNNQFQNLQENLARHTITATREWTLIKRLVQPGEYIQPAQVIATIGDFSQLLLRFALSFNELQNLQQTKDISLYFPDLNLQTSGKIYRVSPTFTEATKKIPVDIIIDNNDQRTIRGGLRGEIQLKQQKNGTFTVPTSAVISRYDAHWIVKENNQRIRVLFLGVTDDGISAIISSKDITTSDRILTKIPESF